MYIGIKQLVAGLLRAACAVLPRPGRGVDLAFIASPDAPGVMLVEVNAGQLSEPALRSAEAQLEHYVREARARLGVLVHHGVEQTPPRRP